MHGLAGFKGSNCLGPGHGAPDPDKAEKLCKALNVWGKSLGAGSGGDLVGWEGVRVENHKPTCCGPALH